MSVYVFHIRYPFITFKRRSFISLSMRNFQASEVAKRQAKMRDFSGNPELAMKLEAAEAKLHDLKANMTILGKEAAAAMKAVEEQQQRLTLHRLITMVWHISTKFARIFPWS